MNTFLPFKDFGESAKALDPVRLRNQRREVLTMLSSIQQGMTMGIKAAWFNHPATQMWCFYPHWLCRYGMVISQECMRRGYLDRCMERFVDYLNIFQKDFPWVDRPPPWLGNPLYHESNQRVLKFKDPGHYSDFKVDASLSYVWPKLKGPSGEVLRSADVCMKWDQRTIDSSWGMWEQTSEAFLGRIETLKFDPKAGLYREVNMKDSGVGLGQSASLDAVAPGSIDKSMI